MSEQSTTTTPSATYATESPLLNGDLWALAPRYATMPRAELARSFPPREQHKNTAPVEIVNLVGVIGRAAQLEFRATMTRIASDQRIGTVVIFIDSPGGLATGLLDCVAAIDRVRRSGKRVLAFGESLIASAAYMLAAACDELTVSADSLVGSIGTVQWLLDDSEQFKQSGLRAIAVASGIHKTTGYPGIEISEEMVATVQTTVNGFAETFLQLVTQRRRQTAQHFVELSQGKVYLGYDAKGLGLVDRIAVFEDWIASVVGAGSQLYDSAAWDYFSKLVCDAAQCAYVDEAPETIIQNIRDRHPVLAARAEEYESQEADRRSRKTKIL